MKFKRLKTLEVFSAPSRLVIRDYQGDEMDLRICIAYLPELIERALIEIIGEMGERILEHIWSSKFQEQFKITLRKTYQSEGDLAKCIRAVHGKADLAHLDL